MHRFSYETVDPTFSNARAIQRLTLSSLIGEVSKPDTIANPGSLRYVNRQRMELAQAPDRFIGAFQKGKLMAFMELGEWDIDHELPYSVPNEALVLAGYKEQGYVHTPERKLGIFGLASSIELSKDETEEAVGNLLYHATDMALNYDHPAINVDFYENDPLRRIAMDQGFQFTGRLHDPMRASGVVKRLYTKPLDIED